LPGCEASREESGETTDYGRAVRVRSKKALSAGGLNELEGINKPGEVERPEKNDNKDLVFAEFDGWPAENMIW
jgi:hypothetical protein